MGVDNMWIGMEYEEMYLACGITTIKKKRRVVSGVCNTKTLSLLSRLYIQKLKERKEEVHVQP